MIAIKNMEMPRSCFCCPYRKSGSLLDGGYYCRLQPIGTDGVLTKSQYRICGEFKDKQGCPLVEIEQTEDSVSLKEVEKWLHQHVNISIPSVETQMFEQLEKELPRVTPTQSWIPISERLPRQEVEVLTCNEHGFIEIQSLEDGYWENQHGDCTDFDDNNVIAWQPLPQPYEEKRGGKVGWSSLENVREKVERGDENG